MKNPVTLLFFFLLLLASISFGQEYKRDTGELSLSFVGSYAQSMNGDEVAQNIKTTLNLNEDWAKVSSTREDTIRNLTLKLEGIGINIVFNSCC